SDVCSSDLASFAQTLGLGISDDCESNLGELGQVQDTVRVNELGAANNQLGWVVINDLADAKAQCGAGVAVSATPHFACSCRCITVAAAHALSLDALAWVDISGARLSHQSLATGDNFAVDAAGDLKCSVDALASDALNGNLDFVVKLHHAVHRVGPADNGAM